MAPRTRLQASPSLSGLPRPGLLVWLVVFGLPAQVLRAAPSPEFGADVLAVVGGEAITLDDFDQSLSLTSGEFAAAAAWQMDEIRKAVLGELIDRRVLLQEARRRGLRTKPGEVEEALAHDKAQAEESGEPFQEGPSRQRLLEDILIRRLLHASIWVRRPGGREVEEYYWRNLGSFRVGEKARIRQIVAKRAAEAVKIAERLKRGENFAALAAESSLGEERSRGGDLGWVGADDLPPDLWQAQLDLEQGRASSPVKTEWGYHILLVEGRSPSRMLPLGEVKEKIEADLARADEEQALQGLSQELRSRADIRINPEFAPYAADRAPRKPVAKVVSPKKAKKAPPAKAAVKPVKTKRKNPASAPGKGKK